MKCRGEGQHGGMSANSSLRNLDLSYNQLVAVAEQSSDSSTTTNARPGVNSQESNQFLGLIELARALREGKAPDRGNPSDDDLTQNGLSGGLCQLVRLGLAGNALCGVFCRRRRYVDAKDQAAHGPRLRNRWGLGRAPPKQPKRNPFKRKSIGPISACVRMR